MNLIRRYYERSRLHRTLLLMPPVRVSLAWQAWVCLASARSIRAPSLGICPGWREEPRWDTMAVAGSGSPKHNSAADNAHTHTHTGGVVNTGRGAPKSPRCHFLASTTRTRLVEPRVSHGLGSLHFLEFAHRGREPLSAYLLVFKQLTTIYEGGKVQFIFRL